MPQALPFIIGAAAIGGTAAVVGQTLQQTKAAKNAANNARSDNAAAAKSVQDAQSAASTQAQAAIKKRARAGTPTIFTSPLGIPDQASTSRKTLLGQ